MPALPVIRNRTASVSLFVSVVALMASGWSALYGTAVGQTQAATTAMSLCREYRDEVLSLEARGLEAPDIVALLSLERMADFDGHSTGSLADYRLYRRNCGSVEQVLDVLAESASSSAKTPSR